MIEYKETNQRSRYAATFKDLQQTAIMNSPNTQLSDDMKVLPTAGGDLGAGGDVGAGVGSDKIYLSIFSVILRSGCLIYRPTLLSKSENKPQ